MDDAKADLEALKELHREHFVGTYDAAVVTKNEEGKVEVVARSRSPEHGGWAGLAVGAALGLIFPPSLLASGLAGAGAGALIGHLRGGMSNSDLKEVGEMLEESEAALIVVGEATIERGLDEAMEHAERMKKEVRSRCQRDGESHRRHVVFVKRRSACEAAEILASRRVPRTRIDMALENPALNERSFLRGIEESGADPAA